MSTDKARKIRRSFKEELARLSDRTQDVRAVCNRLLDSWSFDLDTRKPGIAYIDEDGVPVTDLDLACLLSRLVEHRVVMNIPKYETRRAATVTEGEYIPSKDNRHGRAMGLTPNQETFSFSLLMEDMQIMKSDGTVGAPRNFMLQDITGKWHEGWSSLELVQAGVEQELFEKLNSVTKTIKFKHFVSPNRWPSFYGAPHFLALAADVRLKDQARWLKKEVSRLRKELGIEPPVWAKSHKVGEEKSIEVWAMEVEIDGFELTGEYEPFPATQEGYDAAVSMQKRLRFLQTSLRFQYRATHWAFFSNALVKNIPEDKLVDWLAGEHHELEPRKAAWVKDKPWETAWKEGPRKKKLWARIELKDGLFLRFRVRRKTEKVAADSE